MIERYGISMKKFAALFLALLMVSVLFVTASADETVPVINISKIDNALAFESDALIMTPAFGDSILKTVKTVTKADNTEVKIGTEHKFVWWYVATCEWDTTEKAYVVKSYKSCDGQPVTNVDIPDNGFVLAVHVTDQTNDSTEFANSNKAGVNALAVGSKLYLYNINIAKATIKTSGTFASSFEEAGIAKAVAGGTELVDKDGEAYQGQLVFDNFKTDSFITVGAPSTDATLKAYDPTATVEESEAPAESEESKTETPDTSDPIVPVIALIGMSALGIIAVSKKRR